MKTSISACASAAAALAEIRQKKFQPIPDGWFTLEQYKKHQTCGDTFARAAMKSLLVAGKLEVRRWPVLASDGKTSYSTIYKLK